MDVYEFLSAELRRRRWNMSDLARASGLTKQAVGQWLTEDEAARLVPSPLSCEKIAAALGEDPDYLLELAGHRRRRTDRPSRASDPDLAHLMARWPHLPTGRKEAILALASTIAEVLTVLVKPARTASTPVAN